MNFLKIAIVLFSSIGAAATNPPVMKCTVWETMWVTQTANHQVISEISLTADEDGHDLPLRAGQNLHISRYADWVSLAILRAPSESEKDIFAAKKLNYPLKQIVVAMSSGSLNVGQTNETVDLGSRDYFIRCQY